MSKPDFAALWNSQADAYNTWIDLSDDERLDWAFRCGLERAAEICQSRYMGDNTKVDMEARRCAEAIRGEIEK